MKKLQYTNIFKHLLDGLTEEEKLQDNHRRILEVMFDDLVYNQKFSKYTLNKLKEINEVEK